MSNLSINDVNLGGLTYAAKTLPNYSNPADLSMTYYPAHYNAQGKQVNQRVAIPSYINGKNDRTDTIDIIVWGPLADTICKTLTPGRSFTVRGRLESFKKTLFNKDGSKRLDQNGQEVQVTKHAVLCREFRFGEESAKFGDMEVQQGKRPPYWACRGTQDYELHRANLKARAAIAFNGEQTLGYAKVRMYQGVNYVFGGFVQDKNTGPAVTVSTVAGGPPNGSTVQNYVNQQLDNGAQGQPQTAAATPNLAQVMGHTTGGMNPVPPTGSAVF
jgi:single-stranded DNA-binding protein